MLFTSYDDHAKLILNYKNDTQTITLDELNGSDFNDVTAPGNIRVVAFCYDLIFYPFSVTTILHPMRKDTEFRRFFPLKLVHDMGIYVHSHIGGCMPYKLLTYIDIYAVFRAPRYERMPKLVQMVFRA